MTEDLLGKTRRWAEKVVQLVEADGLPPDSATPAWAGMVLNVFDHFEAEIAHLRQQRDQLQGRGTELVLERRAAAAERDEARDVAVCLLEAIEVLAERAAEVGWIDKDQRVEAVVERARSVLASRGGR